MNKTDKLDDKILRLIGKKSSYTSEMAKNLRVGRTTLQYRLKKLERLGLAKNTNKGRKTIWLPIFKNTHNKSHFKIYKGVEIIHAYEQLLSVPKHTIIFGVQGSEAARTEFSILPGLFIKKAHKIFKRKKIILKGVSNKKALDYFSGLDDSMVKSHKGRTLGIKLFSGNSFLSSGEIMSTKKILLLSNPQSKQAVVIKDRGITIIVYDTLQLMFEMLDDEKTFDLNYYLDTKTASK